MTEGAERSRPPAARVVLELGAGHGRFAFGFVTRLLSELRAAGLGHLAVRYVMTDLAERRLDEWKSHPQLGPLIAAGSLDLATFDAERLGDLRLRHSGETPAPGTVRNPIVVVADYFFDSIPHDAFYVGAGQLHEALVTVSSSRAEPDLSDPEQLARLELSYRRRPAPAPYYDDPELDRLLAGYVASLSETPVALPYGALRCLAHLRRLAGGRMFLLAGDKGYGREDELLEWGEPSLAVHGGCFSLAVNFHALGEWTRNQGGTVLGTPHRSVGLDIWGFVLGLPPQQAGGVRAAFTAAIVEEGPDDLYALLAGIEPHYGTLAVPQVLALLRLSRGDHRILLSCFEVLQQAAGPAPPALKEELSAAIREVWAAYFHIGEERDLPFHLASLLFEMGYADEALEFLRHSVRLSGPNAGTSHNIALCHYRRRELDEALRHMDEALAMDPTFESARKMRLRIRAELGRRKRA